YWTLPLVAYPREILPSERVWRGRSSTNELRTIISDDVLEFRKQPITQSPDQPRWSDQCLAHVRNDPAGLPTHDVREAIVLIAFTNRSDLRVDRDDKSVIASLRCTDDRVFHSITRSHLVNLIPEWARTLSSDVFHLVARHCREHKSSSCRTSSSGAREITGRI